MKKAASTTNAPVASAAPRSDGRCGTAFGGATCDPKGAYGGCCSQYGYVSTQTYLDVELTTQSIDSAVQQQISQLSRSNIFDINIDICIVVCLPMAVKAVVRALRLAQAQLHLHKSLSYQVLQLLLQGGAVLLRRMAPAALEITIRFVEIGHRVVAVLCTDVCINTRSLLRGD